MSVYRNWNDWPPLDEIERRYAIAVLDAAYWNMTTAARVLGINRRTLYRKVKMWGFQRPAPPRFELNEALNELDRTGTGG